MVRLVFLLVFVLLVFAGLRFALRKKQLTVKQFFAIYFATLVGTALLFLALSGRLHPLFAVLGMVLPFLLRAINVFMHGAQVASFIKFLRGAGLGGGGSAKANAPQTSEITSRYIHMVLFHDTGMMDGTVLEGQFKTRKLSQMELGELKTLLKEISSDPESANLLLAYLDREHEGWQDGGEQYEQPQATAGGNMSEAEALDILGLADDASRDDVIQAHRRMMQKVHPDRGGSTYLATKINAAKDLLMGARK